VNHIPAEKVFGRFPEQACKKSCLKSGFEVDPLFGVQGKMLVEIPARFLTPVDGAMIERRDEFPDPRADKFADTVALLL
jgi:hypothetical protein